MKLTEKNCEDLAQQIDIEGFDYYFCHYGPDKKLKKLIGMQIDDYVNAKKNLEKALGDLGIDLDL